MIFIFQVMQSEIRKLVCASNANRTRLEKSSEEFGMTIVVVQRTLRLAKNNVTDYRPIVPSCDVLGRTREAYFVSGTREY